MPERQEFGLNPGLAAFYALLILGMWIAGGWVIVTLDPEHVYRKWGRLGDEGVVIVRVVLIFCLVFFGKFLWELIVSCWLGWRMALSEKGIEVNSVGGPEIFEWSNIASVTMRPHKRLRNGDVVVHAVVLGTHSGQSRKVSFYAFGLTEGDVECAFTKFNRSSKSFFK